MVKSIYLNIEDDLQTIVSKIKAARSPEVVLVCPKKSYLFADSINLRLLKKELDLRNIKVSILTMDEIGQMYAKEAGFDLKYLTDKKTDARRFSDIGRPTTTVFEKPKTTIQPPVAKPTPVAPKRAQPLSVKKVDVPAKSRFINDPAPLVLVKQAEFPKVSGKTKRMMPVKSKGNKKTILTIAGILIPVVILSTLLFTFVLPSGVVTIYPKHDPIVRDMEVSAATGITSVDSEKLIIPATRITKTLSAQKEFQVNGKKSIGTQSTGKVKIINITGKPINLKASTTTLTIAGKQYRFVQDQNSIKAITQKQLASGDYSATVADIIAVSGGEEYNLPAASRLEITNQVFGSQPQVLYAKTETAITGGTSRFVSQISEQDYQEARDKLSQDIVAQVRDQLAFDQVVMLEGSFTIEVVEFQADKPVGTETPSFKSSLRASVKGLGYKEDQLISVIEDRILKSLSTNQKLEENIKDGLAERVKRNDLNTGVLTLDVHIESSATYQVDLAGIPKQLLGKNKQEVSDLILQNSAVDKVEIVISPFWRGTMPKLTSKIKAEIAKQ